MIVSWISPVPSPIGKNGASRMRRSLGVLGVAETVVDAQGFLPSSRFLPKRYTYRVTLRRSTS